MQVSLTEAARQLADLVRHVEAGGDVTLIEAGREVARLVPVPDPRPEQRRATRAELEALLEDIRAKAPLRASGPSAARSQDFLYDEDGLPG